LSPTKDRRVSNPQSPRRPQKTQSRRRSPTGRGRLLLRPQPPLRRRPPLRQRPPPRPPLRPSQERKNATSVAVRGPGPPLLPDLLDALEGSPSRRRALQLARYPFKLARPTVRVYGQKPPARLVVSMKIERLARGLPLRGSARCLRPRTPAVLRRRARERPSPPATAHLDA
jgi:hypothetical protein